MKRVEYSHNIDIAAALVLFCIFAIAVLFVLVTGVNIYQETTSTAASNYQARTAVAYIGEKIRHYDNEFGIEIKPYGDGDGLFLYETIDGDDYETIIYCCDGSLKEIFAIKGIDADPETGFDIIPAQDISFEEINRGKTIEIQYTGTDGQEAQLLISPRAEGAF